MNSINTINGQQIFILGAPRSGTTFLASLLKETRYGTPFETHFITKYYKKLPKYGDISEKYQFKKLISDILSERAVMQWNLSLDLDKFYKQLNPDLSFENIANQICLERNKQLNLNAWGDKTPHYIGDFDIIYKLFPKAKFIFIVRDGRDVSLSLFHKNWGPNNIYSSAMYWKKLHRHMNDIESLKEKGQLFSLRYEDLLDDPRETIPKIYEFLNENCKDKTLDYLCSTVKAGNYYKWKNKLNKSQIKVFDQVAANTLNKFNYETFEQEGDINFLKKSFYLAHEKLLYFKYMFEINVIDGIKIRFFGKEPFAD